MLLIWWSQWSKRQALQTILSGRAGPAGSRWARDRGRTNKPFWPEVTVLEDRCLLASSTWPQNLSGDCGVTAYSHETANRRVVPAARRAASSAPNTHGRTSALWYHSSQGRA